MILRNLDFFKLEILNIQNFVSGDYDVLVSATRYFVARGQFTRPNLKQFQLFLFNDSILWTNAEREYRGLVPLSNLSVSNYITPTGLFGFKIEVPAQVWINAPLSKKVRAQSVATSASAMAKREAVVKEAQVQAATTAATMVASSPRKSSSPSPHHHGHSGSMSGKDTPQNASFEEIVCLCQSIKDKMDWMKKIEDAIGLAHLEERDRKERAHARKNQMHANILQSLQQLKKQ